MSALPPKPKSRKAYFRLRYTAVPFLQLAQDDVAVPPTTDRADHTSRAKAEDDQTDVEGVVRVWRGSEGDRGRIDNGVLGGKEDTWQFQQVAPSSCMRDTHQKQRVPPRSLADGRYSAWSGKG